MLALMLPCLGAWAQISSLSDLNNTTTYTIKSVDRGFLYYDDVNAGYVTSSFYKNQTDATPTGEEKEQFAFLRTTNTTENQYYLYSKAADKFLTYKSGNVALQLTENPEHAWVVARASKGSNNGFTIKVPETTQTYINITNWQAQYGCKVTGTGVDEGNLMTIKTVNTEADFSATAIAKINALEAAERERVMEEIDGLLESTAPFLDPTKTDGGIGAYSYELYICLAYAASNYNLADLKNIVKQYRNSLVLPVAGQFLRIKAVANWNDDAPYLGAKNSTTKTTRAEFVAEADKNTIFYYDGSNLVSFGSGNYLVMDNGNMLGYNGVQTEGSKIAFRLASKGTIGAYNITFDNGNRTLYVNKENYTDAAGKSIDNQDGYCFNLEEVTEIPVTISAAKYASFYAPVAMKVPTGVTAYYINSKKEVNGETWANLEEIGNVIPAGTGVILYSETPNTYYLTVGGEANAIEGNWLTGTAASAYIAEDSYVLSNNYGIGLYLADKNQEGNTWLNNGFKAYLPVVNTETTSGVLRFNFDGTTAIESVLNNSADANAPIYDLSGRRVMNTVKGGIYIQNGKKFIVK